MATPKKTQDPEVKDRDAAGAQPPEPGPPPASPAAEAPPTLRYELLEDATVWIANHRVSWRRGRIIDLAGYRPGTLEQLRASGVRLRPIPAGE